MFYWKVGRHQIVLTEAEESKLLERAGFSASERIAFFVATPKGRALQQRAALFLEDYASRNPAEFYRDYVERRGSGPEALDVLRALVDAYQLTTGRAIWGAPRDLDLPDKVGLAAWLGRRPDAVSITLTVPTTRMFRKRTEPVGLLAFPSAEIEKFVGTGESFLLITSRMSVHFGGAMVRVVSLPDFADDELP